MTQPAALDPTVIREAARWLACLHSGRASADDFDACRRWRTAHPAHEQAWCRAERLSAQFGAVPPALGVPLLTRQARSNRRAAAKTLAVLAAAAPAAWLGYRQAPWQAWTADHATATGERLALDLPDGSRLTLNTDSAVDLHFSPAERRVTLRRGEIHVQTAPDPQAADDRARPFVVASPQGRMRALGTRFVVRLLEPQLPRTLLTVLEHRVEVIARDGEAPVVVPQGRRVHFDSRRIGVPETAAPAPPGWMQGVLYADDQRLADFLAELSRYRPGILRCDPAVAELRISGAFQLADTDYVLDIVRETLPVDVMLRTRYWVTVVPAPAA